MLLCRRFEYQPLLLSLMLLGACGDDGAGTGTTDGSTDAQADSSDGAARDSTVDGSIVDGSRLTDGSVKDASPEDASAEASADGEVDGGTLCETLDDETFLDGDWHIVLATPDFGGVGNGIHEDAGGNPGAFYRFEFESNGFDTDKEGGSHTIHIRDKDPFVPGLKGEVVSISAKVDTNVISATGGVEVGLAIRQFSSFYWTGPNAASGGWSTISTTEKADFVKFYGPENDPDAPDFSNSGPKIDLGFMIGNTKTAGQDIVNNTGFDNFSFTICYKP